METFNTKLSFDVNAQEETNPNFNDEYTKKQVEESNSRCGSLPFYDCPLCKNKGAIYYAYYDKDWMAWDMRAKKCPCMIDGIRELYRKNYESGLGNYLEKRFPDFTVIEEWQKGLYDNAINYCKSESTSWFVMLGQSGCGKTLLSSIVANYLLHKGKKVKYIVWTNFISQLKRDIMGIGQEAASSNLNEVKSAEVLFIDELLKCPTEADVKYFVEIINYRYSNGLQTIITSEKTIDQLIAIDEATAGRIIEMSNSYLSIIGKDIHKNQRLKNIKGFK